MMLLTLSLTNCPPKSPFPGKQMFGLHASSQAESLRRKPPNVSRLLFYPALFPSKTEPGDHSQKHGAFRRILIRAHATDLAGEAGWEGICVIPTQ